MINAQKFYIARVPQVGPWGKDEIQVMCVDRLDGEHTYTSIVPSLKTNILDMEDAVDQVWQEQTMADNEDYWFQIVETCNWDLFVEAAMDVNGRTN